MALTSLTLYKAQVGIVTTDATRDASLSALISAFDGAVKKLCQQNIEQSTWTHYFDAPYDTPDLILREGPVSSITSLYYDPAGYAGQGADAFASTTQLTAGTDFFLVPDQADGTSKRRRVRRIGMSSWASPLLLRPYSSLSARPTSPVGAIKCVYVAGFSSVPADLTYAVNLAVARAYQMREKGVAYTSESWNGRSEAVESSALAAGILRQVDIWSVIQRYALNGGYAVA